MARFLIGTIPVIGHINPIIPIAAELVARGHHVCWYTGEQFRLKVEMTGAAWRPMKRAVSFYGTQGMDAFPERMALQGVDRVRWDIENVFIPDAAKQADDLAEILADFPADAVLCDTMFLGARFLHERDGGPPWAKLNITVLGLPDTAGDAPPLGLGLTPGDGIAARARNRSLHWMSDNVLFRDLHQKYRDARRDYGLPEGNGTLTDDLLSPYLWLQGSVPSFEYPYRNLPPQVHFVGPLLPSSGSSFTLPSWSQEIERKQRPVVLVTQGTISVDPKDLIQPVCRALASEDILVIATTAGAPIDTPVPDNARIASFLPYDRILPHVDAVVTNGSYGTVQHALAYGVPMVASGATEDKIEVCARVEWSGVGVRVKGSPPREDHLRNAVKRVLSDSKFKTAAQRIQSEMQRRDGPKEAATLLEELARTKHPVTATRSPIGKN
ncbi:glycosyl transferase [Capsulimonas corticalis]|uniref:Glycosyl transferase n=1 Tax=Capsulimonas corticalis TaxID=2219043 RepID=A0A402CU18_9BACT|nr:nucleotide disphospho-sugar-binding domain-containing protein [Capsulimonas corticalis]BDI28816.1 glycosyl transferase [Capsulimonas corticalis]